MTRNRESREGVGGLEEDLVAKIKEMVQKINTRDPEKAHAQEDLVYITALKIIATGTDEAAKIAREALTALDLDFHRWTP